MEAAAGGNCITNLQLYKLPKQPLLHWCLTGWCTPQGAMFQQHAHGCMIAPSKSLRGMYSITAKPVPMLLATFSTSLLPIACHVLLATIGRTTSPAVMLCCAVHDTGCQLHYAKGPRCQHRAPGLQSSASDSVCMNMSTSVAEDNCSPVCQQGYTAVDHYAQAAAEHSIIVG